MGIELHRRASFAEVRSVVHRCMNLRYLRDQDMAELLWVIICSVDPEQALSYVVDNLSCAYARGFDLTDALVWWFDAYEWMAFTHGDLATWVRAYWCCWAFKTTVTKGYSACLIGTSFERIRVDVQVFEQNSRRHNKSKIYFAIPPHYGPPIINPLG